MTAKLVPFEAWHALDIMARSTEPAPIVFQPQFAEMIEACGGAYSLIVNSDVVACGGLLEMWPGRYQAWMFFTPDAGPHMARITKRVRQELETTPGRIEMTVNAEYETGKRWARMLGFKIENPPGILAKYGPAGEDHVSFVRVS